MVEFRICQPRDQDLPDGNATGQSARSSPSTRISRSAPRTPVMMAMTESRNDPRVATLAERHFSIVKPRELRAVRSLSRRNTRELTHEELTSKTESSAQPITVRPRTGAIAACVCRSPLIVRLDTSAWSTSRANVFDSDSGFNSPPPRCWNTGDVSSAAPDVRWWSMCARDGTRTRTYVRTGRFKSEK